MIKHRQSRGDLVGVVCNPTGLGVGIKRDFLKEPNERDFNKKEKDEKLKSKSGEIRPNGEPNGVPENSLKLSKIYGLNKFICFGNISGCKKHQVIARKLSSPITFIKAALFKN